MKITKSKGREIWSDPAEDDIQRHTLIFRLLSLGETLVDFALDDPDTRSRYDSERAARGWQSAESAAPVTEENVLDRMLPLIGWELKTDEDGSPDIPYGVFIGALDGDQFVLLIANEEFQATVSLLYDLAEPLMLAGFVAGFTGAVSEAIEWAENFEADLLADPGMLEEGRLDDSTDDPGQA